MDIFQTIILSIVEGLTEFLPVSSTGHMVLTADLLRIPQSDFLSSFEIIIQIGAIAAILFLYIRNLIENPHRFIKIFIAFLPTGLAGAILYPVVKQHLIVNPTIVAFSLLIGGFILIFFDKKIITRSRLQPIDSLSISQLLIIGSIQTFAIMPGISRSAATIIGGILVGLSKKDAIIFSFLLAIPTITGAVILDLLNRSFQFSTHEASMLIIGILGAFVTALIVVRIFLSLLERITLAAFGYYRIALALIYLLYTLIIKNI